MFSHNNSNNNNTYNNSCPRDCTVDETNICGESNNNCMLEIMKELNGAYEEKMEQLDAAGECLVKKVELQREWIKQLTQQNEILVNTVQQVEQQNSDRVQQLEEKLQKNAQCLCEIMKKYREHDFTLDLLAEPLQKVSDFEDDLKNIFEFIRRIREDKNWSVKGLLFHNVKEQDLLGKRNKICDQLQHDDGEEGEKMINSQGSTIQELTEKLDHFKKLGNIESMIQELESRRNECECLKQELQDTRQVLTEEVATKHDEIIGLKREVQLLEEKLIQADKQIAFKDDIVKELRKEIKQLKLHFTQEEVTKLNCTIEELRANLEQTRLIQLEEEKSHLEEISVLNCTLNCLQEKLNQTLENNEKDKKTCRICKRKSRVGFLENSEVQTVNGLEAEEEVCSKNFNKMKNSSEVLRHNNEVQLLQCKVNELENALKNCEARAENLQEAVNLYTNSVNVLEHSDEEHKNQIDEQKITIKNLQSALVQCKQELDNFRKKNEEKDIQLTELQDVLENLDDDNELIKKLIPYKERQYLNLQEINFNLEIDHYNNLQDQETLEENLKKYQHLCKFNEDQLSKLAKQKHCYEEVIGYFKCEMAQMADQLVNLQELLTLSNESAQEESNKIMESYMEVQNLNKKLSNELCVCEQKIQLESQMNQLQEAKICQLQRLLHEKEAALNKHDNVILNIRKTLNESAKQNEDLQNTIAELNGTVHNLECSIRQYEYKNCTSRKSCSEFQQQIENYCRKLDDLKKDLEEKSAECLKLELAYNNEKRALKIAQKQLLNTEKLQQENQRDLVNSAEDMKEKLKISEENNKKLCDECENLQSQLSNISRKEAVKDLEIKRYRKIVGDLKSTMMELNTELNKNLAQKELKTTCKKNCNKENPKDICLSCPCEVEFYQKMIDILKKSVTDLKTKLTDAETKSKDLEEKLQEKETELKAIRKAKQQLELEINETRTKDKKIAELEKHIGKLTENLSAKSLQLDNVRKDANDINGSKCVQLACAQEEITNLKNEMANLLNRQYNLKRENEEMQSQTAQLYCTINCLNEKNRQFKEQIEQNLNRIKNLNCEKETLIRKNRELLNELKTIQSLTCNTSSRPSERFNTTVDNLKQHLHDLKANKDEICVESKNVIKNVRNWAMEQRRINSFIAKREQQFIEIIRQLYKGEKTCKANKSHFNQFATSPCSLGTESLSPSPEFCSSNTNDWYSSSFKPDSEYDSEEDYCVNTLENLTQQMRQSNNLWVNEKKSHCCNNNNNSRATKEKK